MGEDRQLPRHVAIIMDGNGRWAVARGLPRQAGHLVGVEAVRRAVRHASEVGIEYLTLFAFSSENWRRPAQEIGYLFGLLKNFVRRDVADLKRNNVRVRMIGSREGLEGGIVDLLQEAEAETAACTGLTLIVAFNYGSRQEMASAAQKAAREVLEGRIRPEAITPEYLAGHLDTAGIPDPDLMIRTSGEVRLSNFLLWQCAYTEFIFVPEAWPDFTESVFERTLAEYQARDRRFGGVKP